MLCAAWGGFTDVVRFGHEIEAGSGRGGHVFLDIDNLIRFMYHQWFHSTQPLQVYMSSGRR